MFLWHLLARQQVSDLLHACRVVGLGNQLLLCLGDPEQIVNIALP